MVEIIVKQGSLPLRECGLKSAYPGSTGRTAGVTPFAGVWIEIAADWQLQRYMVVTPFAGVWIEIHLSRR